MLFSTFQPEPCFPEGLVLTFRLSWFQLSLALMFMIIETLVCWVLTHAMDVYVQPAFTDIIIFFCVCIELDDSL